MPTLQQSILIAAPIKRVFGFLEEIERVPEWLPRVIEAHRTSETLSGVGAELAVVVEAGGRRSSGTSRCVEAETANRLVFQSSLDIGLTSTMTFDLTAQGHQTQLVATVEYAFAGRGFGRLIGGLFGNALAKKDIEAGLASLKSQLEAKPARRRKAASTP